MPLFGKKPTEPQRSGFKVVRRAPCDTSPPHGATFRGHISRL